MTRLRKMMLEELQRRNYSEDTIRHHLRAVKTAAAPRIPGSVQRESRNFQMDTVER